MACAQDSGAAYHFACCLSLRDADRTFLGPILDEFSAQDEAALTFLSGYLAGIFDRDSTEWESVLTRLTNQSSVSSRFSDIVIASGLTDSMARMVVAHCRNGAQGVERLDRWWFSPRLQQLSPGVAEELVALQLDDARGTTWGNAVQMCHEYFLENRKGELLPEELVFRLLTSSAMAADRTTHSVAYYWSRLAARFIEQYPARKWEFFRAVLTASASGSSTLLDLNTNQEQVLTSLLQEEPKVAFGIIVDVYNQLSDLESFSLQRWLSDDGHRLIGDERAGPIQYIPTEALYSWVDENVDEHGYWLARMVPKTLDHSIGGRLTRDFIARFGRNRTICSALYARFHSRGWCGNASDHYRKLRDEARGWISGDSNPIVVDWVEDYIDGLTADIDRAELDEERRF